jgi:hypothetical protein
MSDYQNMSREILIKECEQLHVENAYLWEVAECAIDFATDSKDPLKLSLFMQAINNLKEHTRFEE